MGKTKRRWVYANSGRGIGTLTLLFWSLKMTNKYTLTAVNRVDVGKGASRRLRHADSIPAIVYGTNKAPQAITLIHNQVSNALKNEAFYSSILTLDIDNKAEKVVVKDMQRHPYKPRILHMDFQRVSETEKLTMNIPLHFVGGDVAPGVKVDGGLISHLASEVAIRCLPKDLPEFLEVDLSGLKINEAAHLSNIKLAAGVEIVDLIHGDDRAVATVYIPRAVVEEVAAPVTAAVPVAGEDAAAAEAAAAADKEKLKAGAEPKKKD